MQNTQMYCSLMLHFGRELWLGLYQKYKTELPQNSFHTFVILNIFYILEPSVRWRVG